MNRPARLNTKYFSFRKDTIYHRDARDTCNHRPAELHFVYLRLYCRYLLETPKEPHYVPSVFGENITDFSKTQYLKVM